MERGGARSDGARGGRSHSERGRADLALVQRALEGQSGAEARLAVRFECLPRILRHIVSRLSPHIAPADFEDLVQDTALALWRKLEQFDGRSALETWAYRFCTLQTLVHLRNLDRRHPLLDDADARERDAGGGVDNEPTAPTVDIEAALALLEPAEERVARMKHFDGGTFEAIGAELGISANTAKTRYYRALVKLRDHLRGRHPDLFGGGGSS